MEFNNLSAVSYLKARNLMCGDLRCGSGCPYAEGFGVCNLEREGHEEETVHFVMSWAEENLDPSEYAFNANDTKSVSNQKALSEALDAVENGMCRIADTRDIWQNELLYALCQTVRLLGVDKLKELHNIKKI